MSCFKLIVVLVLLGTISLSAQAPATNAASGTNAPSATPPVPIIAIGDVVGQAELALQTLQNEQKQLAEDPTTQAAKAQLPLSSQQVDKQLASDKRILEADPGLPDFQKSQAAWQAITKDLSSSNVALTTRANQLSGFKDKLAQETKIWNATLTTASGAPVETLNRIKVVLAEIRTTEQARQSLLNQILSVQSRILEQNLRITAATDAIAKAEAVAQQQLFEQDHPFLWTESLISVAARSAAQENDSLHDQVEAVRVYLMEQLPALGVNGLILVILTLALYRIRQPIRARAEKEPELKNAEHAFASPFATAILLSLTVFHWLYPTPPRLWLVGVAICALVPVVFILRRLLEPGLYPVLYALVSVYLVDRFRHVLIPQGTFSRLLLVFELLAGSLFIIWFLRSGRLTAWVGTARLLHWLRPYLHLTLWVFIFAGLANVLGYVNLSIALSSGMLSCSYVAMVLYGTVRIVDALIFGGLSIPPLANFRIVQGHRSLIHQKLSDFINWLALATWLLAVLRVFPWSDTVWGIGPRLVSYHFPWVGAPSVGDVLLFGLTVWLTFLISRFVRFILAEEVYPHLALGRGVSYTASTLIHYTILAFGFLMALHWLQINILTDYPFVSAAFGVGLGFGLQNILNNFVSGIILLFERPIKVGDTLQMDAGTGVVESIGIRASVIRLANGASIIMPNGNLISSPVTNWSLRHNRRLIEIPLSITSKAEPQPILDLLVRTAKSHDNVLKNPPPQALLVTLSGTGFALKLRVYVDAETDWTQVTSDLSMAINSALAKEGIAVG